MIKAERDKWLATYHLLAASGVIVVEFHVEACLLKRASPNWIWRLWRKSPTRQRLVQKMHGSFTANKWGRRYIAECRAFFAKTYCSSGRGA